MAIRNVRLENDEILRKKSRTVEVIDDKIKELVDDMIETMHAHDGVGLAAPQVGILKRVVVIDLYDDKGPIIMINPVITKTKGEQEVEEGCLSFPNQFAKVIRPSEVTVKALDRDGKEYKLKGKGLLAQAISHEVDHLEGILFVDKIIPGTKVEISKVDMTDGSSEVEGAKLYILNENNEVMESWTSGKKPHYLEKLPVGKYTLLEETAPKGYIISSKVPFEVKDTGEIQSVKMEDAQAMGKIILNKTDKDTKKPMKGVEFALCDSKGKVLETLVTDSAGHAESGEYPLC